MLNNFYMRACLYFRILAAAMVRPLKGPGGAVAPEAILQAKLIRADGSSKDFGIIGTKVVTDAYVDFIVDNMVVETAEAGDAKFHDSGTGVVAEAAGDTTLGTKVESGRVSGTQLEGASTNIYRSVGTIAYTATRAITEHGLFTITSAGTLVDRTVFSAINVDNGDSIQFTYELTFPAGS